MDMGASACEAVLIDTVRAKTVMCAPALGAEPPLECVPVERMKVTVMHGDAESRVQFCFGGSFTITYDREISLAGALSPKLEAGVRSLNMTMAVRAGNGVVQPDGKTIDKRRSATPSGCLRG